MNPAEFDRLIDDDVTRDTAPRALDGLLDDLTAVFCSSDGYVL